MLVIGAVVFVETMFYAAIAPLLPSLVHELGLSKLSAGLLTASYPAGALIASLPAGVLAVRTGPRFTVCAGLLLLAASTVAFGVLDNVATLDIARFVEGVGGACTWAGGLAWLVADTPAERRGSLIGDTLGAAIAGALFGPVLGTIAGGIGRGPTFGAIALLTLFLLVHARRLPSSHVPSGQGVRQVLAVLRRREVVVGIWLVALPALTSGTITVLAPLRLHELGAGTLAIGATFLVGAALEAVVTPAVGKLSDRHGRMIPLRFGLLVVTGVLLLFTVPASSVLLALVLVVFYAALGVFWAPAMAMLSDAAERSGLDQALAAAIMNLAWALGVIVGSAGGGAAAKLTGDGVPVLVASALCAASLVVLSMATPGASRRGPAGRTAPHTSRRAT